MTRCSCLPCRLQLTLELVDIDMQDSKRAFEEISVEPLSPSVGAEISGTDLSAGLTDAQFSNVRRALGEFGVIFIRGQDISPAAHIKFARRFGDIDINKYFQPVDGFPEIASVQRQPNSLGYPHSRRARVNRPSITNCAPPRTCGGVWPAPDRARAGPVHSRERQSSGAGRYAPGRSAAGRGFRPPTPAGSSRPPPLRK